VVPPVAGTEPDGAAADEPVEVASPSTLIASPPRVTGADTPTGACAPERMPSEPDVVAPEPVEAAGEPDGEVDVLDPDEPASPSTLTALPVAVTGAETAIGACAPESTPPVPDVVWSVAGAVPDEAVEEVEEVEPPEPELEVEPESPTALTAFPLTVTGTAMLTSAWSPEATPPSPLVDVLTAGAGAAGADCAPVDPASPSTAMPLPETVTGTVSPIAACSPEATPLEPVVDGASAAFAAAVPASQSPPTQRVNHNPLETYLFIVQPFE
jgi:hypothetical protein